MKKLVVDMSRTQDTSCFTFLYFHLITSKFLYFQCEARFSEQITLPASGPQCRLALIYLPVVDFAVKCYSHIPYSGKLSREKTFARIGGNTIFAEKTCADCSLLQRQRTSRPKFRGENFAYSHKTAKFAKVFPLESFPLYGNRISFPVK